MSEVLKILIGAVTILFGAFIAAGRYTTERPGQGMFIFVVDRFTGTTKLCNADGCHDLQNNVPDPWAPVNSK